MGSRVDPPGRQERIPAACGVPATYRHAKQYEQAHDYRRLAGSNGPAEEGHGGALPRMTWRSTCKSCLSELRVDYETRQRYSTDHVEGMDATGDKADYVEHRRAAKPISGCLLPGTIWRVAKREPGYQVAQVLREEFTVPMSILRCRGRPRSNSSPKT